jgi:hypothetical protein
MMKQLLAQNWKSAVSEVIASVVGTVGIIWTISLILSLQSGSREVSDLFSTYFSGGQLGLPILALSGVIFIALRRHGRLNAIVSLLLYVFLILPIITTSFLVGINPGFKEKMLGSGNLQLLWAIFFGLHFLWFLILILEPAVLSAQEAGREQEGRVNKIKAGAEGRG